MTHVDAAEHQRSAFIERTKRGRYNLTGGSEDDGGIQALRRLFSGAASPDGAQFECQLSMFFVARAGVNLDSPEARHLQSNVGCRSEAVNAQAAAGLQTRQFQRPVSDDAGAQQRSRLQVRKSGRKVIDKRGRGDGVGGIPAIHRVAGEIGRFTEILLARFAVFANAARVVKPCHAYAIARIDSEDSRARFFHDAYNLVAGDNGHLLCGKLSFDDVQVGTADTAGRNANENAAGSGFGDGKIVVNLERVRFDGSRMVQHTGNHAGK